MQYLVDYMKEKGYAPATIRTELSALRSLYRKAGGKGRLPDNKKLGVPKEERGKENRTWTKEEFEKAITTGGLKVTGKGGRVRTVPVQTEEQKAVVRMPYKYATDNKLQRVISLSARTSTRVWKRRKSPFKVGSTITVRSLWIKTEPLRLSRVKKRKSEKVSFHGLRYGYAQKLKERLDSEGVKNAAKQVSRVSDTTVSP